MTDVHMVTTEIPVDHCPRCGVEVECASSIYAAVRPAPGCIVVCVQCAGINIFDENLKLCEFDQKELETHPEFYKQVLRVQDAIRDIRAKEHRKKTQPRLRYREVLWRRRR